MSASDDQVPIQVDQDQNRSSKELKIDSSVEKEAITPG